MRGRDMQKLLPGCVRAAGRLYSAHGKHYHDHFIQLHKGKGGRGAAEALLQHCDMHVRSTYLSAQRLMWPGMHY